MNGAALLLPTYTHVLASPNQTLPAAPQGTTNTAPLPNPWSSSSGSSPQPRTTGGPPASSTTTSSTSNTTTTTNTTSISGGSAANLLATLLQSPAGQQGGRGGTAGTQVVSAMQLATLESFSLTAPYLVCVCHWDAGSECYAASYCRALSPPYLVCVCVCHLEASGEYYAASYCRALLPYHPLSGVCVPLGHRR